MRVAFLLLLSLCVASARVGESFEEFRKRFKNSPYGEWKSADSRVYRCAFANVKSDPTVKVCVVDGTVSLEEYHGVSQALAELILQRQGADWKRIHTLRTLTRWESPSGKTAELHDRVLVVTDGRFDSLMAEAKKAEEEQIAEQF